MFLNDNDESPEFGDEDLSTLRGLPVQKLVLNHDFAWVTDFGLAELKGLPLTWLSLGRSDHESMEGSFNDITDSGIEKLVGLPLRFLKLVSLCQLTEKCLPAVASLPLDRLVLEGCENLELDHLGTIFSRPLQHLAIIGAWDVSVNPTALKLKRALKDVFDEVKELRVSTGIY